MDEILLFGVTREIVGSDTLKLPAGGFPESVGALKQMLLRDYPALEEIASLKVAVNSAFATDDVALTSGDEVALIPPVSGG